ncbi:hypothetical protein PR003_g15051 [Phytophthora rubi]|uniref:Uncharacterized protein n=1 Tax=Phytophthora rubi TaxID=129364 RepID=A0A6A4ESX2_9STRA|nr:hypothetical protein PR002_g15322 [Phytophthora rubi]KAE9015672.1 hypothetical protein PR001_g14842 [Phytophthora rubi]KAE9331349.1 hypothetical protein PR003_g15051 [Phytophthora rubi]
MFETPHGVVTILDQAVALGVEIPASFLSSFKGIFRLSMLTAGRVQLACQTLHLAFGRQESGVAAVTAERI